MGEPAAFRYASQIAEGLSAMHALGLAHHDVSLEKRATLGSRALAPRWKSSRPLSLFALARPRRVEKVSLENVMLTSAPGGDAVVIDFGMVVKVPLKPTPEARGEQRVPYRAPVMLRPALSWPCKCGKMLYMAPELLEARRPFDVLAGRG